MKCDQAFELMTDPVGATSPSLQRHLERCPRCRQMQLTLSPALEWMRSSGDEPFESTRGADPTAPFLSTQAVLVAEQAARRLPRRNADWGDSARRALWISAVAVLGFACGVLMSEPRSPERHFVPAGATLAACLWDQPALRDALPDATARGVVVSCVACHVPTLQ
jgi:hypothetical protein